MSKVTNVDVYQLVQIMPADGYVAVFAVEDLGSPGDYRLAPVPVDCLGLASITTETHEEIQIDEDVRLLSPGQKFGPVTEVVGLILEEGEWQIANEAENFAGLARSGEDISSVTWSLDPVYKDNLVA